LFLARLLRGERPKEALSKTASSVYAVLEETHRVRAREIRLIATQDAITDPPARFAARQVR
jgi:pyridoxine kinase